MTKCLKNLYRWLHTFVTVRTRRPVFNEPLAQLGAGRLVEGGGANRLPSYTLDTIKSCTQSRVKPPCRFFIDAITLAVEANNIYSYVHGTEHYPVLCLHLVLPV